MPILSAANGTQFPEDARFNPTTDLTRADAPEYAFYFYAEGAFYDNFHFDNCREYIHLDRSIPYQEINFGNQEMYYKRLFKFPKPVPGCKYYLCPWLMVPFEEPAPGSFSAALNPLAGSVQQLSLTIKPFSIFETAISTKTKKRIRANARTLELFSPGNGVRAVWNNPKPGGPATVIDEVACIAKQKITVTIDSLTSPYAYSSFLDIRVNSLQSVGRIYFVFLQIKRKNTIFLEVSPPAGANPVTNTILNVKMLSVAESQSRVDRLNKTMRLASLLYTDLGVPIELTDATQLNSGGSIPFDIGKVINPTSKQQLAFVTSEFISKIAKINNLNWDHNNSPYVLVFLMSYIKLVEVQQTEQATITGTTKGASDYDSRIARVFDETGNTIAHECAHALGLPHWFHTATDILAEIGRIAEARAPTIGIFSTEQLYLFHDASHVDGLEIVFNKRFSSSSPPTLASRVVTLRFLFFPRIYQMSQTDNLMDYQTNGLPAHQEQLRKHQVEQIRYFA